MFYFILFYLLIFISPYEDATAEIPAVAVAVAVADAVVGARRREEKEAKVRRHFPCRPARPRTRLVTSSPWCRIPRGPAWQPRERVSRRHETSKATNCVV